MIDLEKIERWQHKRDILRGYWSQSNPDLLDVTRWLADEVPGLVAEIKRLREAQ